MSSFSIGLNAGVDVRQPGSARPFAAVSGKVAPPEQGEDAGNRGNRQTERPVVGASASEDTGAPERQPAREVDANGLTKAEQDMVRELRARDAEVRRHEEAHARVGGQYAGQPSYTFQTGPDGKRYAIGGEVSIDVSPVPDDPEATIAKMSVVKRAALAPAEPSGQDRRVAALADRQSLDAQAQLNAQRLEEQAEGFEELRQGRSTFEEDTTRLGLGEEFDQGRDLNRAA
ncbi:MAG: putative metalloprotease CJM1_0395 family protein [Pseudomonadota bacterium]